MAWPTVEDLKDYLIAAGLYSDPPSAIQSLLNLEEALNAAIEQWNDTTHYWPFMSNGDANETRYFDPPNCSRLLDLDSGLLQIASLASNQQYEAGGTNSLSAGTARTNFLDFRLKPPNAASKGKPYTFIELGWWPTGITGSIAVTGEWGFCTSANVPNAAKIAVKSIAAGMLMPQIQLQISRGGLNMLQRGDETKKWDTKMLEETFATDLSSVLKMNPQYIRHRMSQ